MDRDGDLLDDLVFEGHADSARTGPCPGKCPIVKSTPATESSAAAVEGEPGAEEGVDVAEGDLLQAVGGFAHAEGPGDEFAGGLADGMEAEFLARDARKQPASRRVALRHGQQVGFPGQRGEEGDRAKLRVIAQPAVGSGDECRGIGRRVGRKRPHPSAQQGLVIVAGGGAKGGGHGRMRGFRRAQNGCNGRF